MTKDWVFEVWVLLDEVAYEGGGLLGVYSSEELATAAIDQFEWPPNTDARIECRTLDAPPRNR
jgi:hypothetical protein